MPEPHSSFDKNNTQRIFSSQSPAYCVFEQSTGMEKNERLKQARIDAGFRFASHAADSLGVKRPTYAHHENGTRDFGADEARQYARRFKVSVEWLLYGSKSGSVAAAGDLKISRSSPLQPVEVTFTSLPIVGKVAAGFWRSCDYAGEPDQFDMMTAIMNPQYPQEAQFMLEVEGESLNKLAPNGSHLHCVKLFDAGIDPNNLEDGQLVIVQRTRHQFGEFEMTAKRIRKNGDFELWPESDKPEFQEPIRVADFLGESDETIEIIAIVTAIIKKP